MRIATATLAIPVVLVINRLGGWVFGVALALTAVVGTVECYRMAKSAGYRPLVLPGLAAAAVLAALPIAVHQPQAAWTGALVALLMISGSYYVLPHAYSSGLASWMLTVGPVLYVGLLLGQLSLLRTDRHGAWWVFAVLVITWAYDTGAFFAGRTWGKHGFMQHVSAKKTVEGVIGGLLLSTLASLIAVPTVGLATGQALALGLLLGVAAQLGDLVESMIKRQAGVKDAGAILPGHGGLLDRIDSLLFTGALATYAALLLGYAS